jgi:hypothetical protein
MRVPETKGLRIYHQYPLALFNLKIEVECLPINVSDLSEARCCMVSGPKEEVDDQRIPRFSRDCKVTVASRLRIADYITSS